jgi:hypothetical protein
MGALIGKIYHVQLPTRSVQRLLQMLNPLPQLLRPVPQSRD